MKGIVAKKIGMTQIYDSKGSLLPITVLQAEVSTVVGVKEEQKHGYAAFQLASTDAKEKHLTKAQLGLYKKHKLSPKRNIKEFASDSEHKVGDEIGVSIFEDVAKVTVTSNSKGRGFSGTIKRYGFARGPMTHGSHNKRAPGSIGACASPARVFPGKKMPGQYGNKQNTVKNLKLVKIDTEKQLLFVRGAVPGHKNIRVIVKKAV